MNTDNKKNKSKKSDKKLHISDVRRSFSFTYDDLFKAFVAGDTESMRTGDDVDREEFEEWFEDFFKKNYK
tara:strand:+ start:104 stop:313 length:210 start_codon:yes stop_codon:yes gene_type:complete